MEVRLTIRIPDSWVRDIGEVVGKPVRFIQSIPDGKEGGRGLIEIRGDAELASSMVPTPQTVMALPLAARPRLS